MNRKESWPKWHDILDMVYVPYFGAFICMMIAPAYIFSKKIRKELASYEFEGRITFFIFIAIGAILWVAGFILLSIMFIDLLSN